VTGSVGWRHSSQIDADSPSNSANGAVGLSNTAGAAGFTRNRIDVDRVENTDLVQIDLVWKF
jgi:hypothetical protein